MKLKFAHFPSKHELVASGEHEGKHFQLYLDKKHNQGSLLGDLGEHQGTMREITVLVDSKLNYFGSVAELVRLKNNAINKK